MAKTQRLEGELTFDLNECSDILCGDSGLWFWTGKQVVRDCWGHSSDVNVLLKLTRCSSELSM